MRRDGDNKVGSYLRQVDRLSETNFGLPFTAVQSDVEEAAGIQMASEMNAGLSPEGFVGLLERTFPLRRVGDELGATEAAAANRGVLALASYARVSPDWGLGPDGMAYRERDGGVDRLAYSPDRTGSTMGFVCARADGASLDEGLDGRPVPAPGAEFANVAGALDIGDSIDAFERTLDAGHEAPGLR